MGTRTRVNVLTPALVVLLSALVVTAVVAAPLAQATFTATEDVFINRDVVDTNHNAYPLRLGLVGAPSPGANQVILLKFSIGTDPLGGSAAVEQARLTLATIGLPCGSAASAQSVALYGMTNSGWAEGTATWTSASGYRGALLDTSDTTLPSTGHVTWTDTVGGAGSFAAYVESARTGNAGVVALWLEMSGSAAVSESATLENHERVGQTNSCAGADLAPTLQISGSGSPLAISLVAFSATEDRSILPLAIGTGILVTLGTGGLIVWRRRVVRA